jgi:flagellin
MAISDISLTSGMKSNLLSLQNTVTLLNRTQQRLSSGKKVNSALDDPTSYFTAQALDSRAGIIDGLKDAMGQAVQTVTAANQGVTAITSLIEQAKAVAQSAQSSTGTALAGLATQYDGILTQITSIAADSGYQGKNLLAATNNTLAVQFEGAHSLTITGFDASATGLSLINAASGGSTWATSATNITNSITALDAAKSTLSSNSSSLASNLSIITVRQNFSTNMVNTLTTGADSLTLADTNEEGANMLMLQTRQSLGVTALSLSSQAAQSVLKLFA